MCEAERVSLEPNQWNDGFLERDNVFRLVICFTRNNGSIMQVGLKS